LNRKIITIAAGSALGVAALLGVAACSHSGNSTGSALELGTSRQDLTTFEQAQAAPHFPYSEIRAAAIKVEASQALGEQTTSFFYNLGSRDPLFSCPSVGDPIPFSTEITNPVAPENYTNGNGDYNTIPVGNIDPNGIYAPSSSAGTNVMCVDASGQQYLVYWEGDVFTVNGAARWDAATSQIVVTGQPTMPTCKSEAGKTTCTK